MVGNAPLLWTRNEEKLNDDFCSYVHTNDSLIADRQTKAPIFTLLIRLDTESDLVLIVIRRNPCVGLDFTPKSHTNSRVEQKLKCC